MASAGVLLRDGRQIPHILVDPRNANRPFVTTGSINASRATTGSAGLFYCFAIN